MNGLEKGNICKKEGTRDFAVMHNDVAYFERGRIRARQVETVGKYIYPNEIIEYTDEVSEQMRIMYSKITVILKDYFSGVSSIEEVCSAFRQNYKSIKSFCMNMGFITENYNAYKSKLLKDIYRNYRHNSVIVAMDINDSEGVKMLSTDLKETSNQSIIFYNSDYYYMCKILRDTIRDVAHRLAVEDNIRNFETESIDKRKRYIFDYDFNEAWSLKNKAKISSNREGKLLIPPKDLKILYLQSEDKSKEEKLVICFRSQRIDYPILKLKEEEFRQELIRTIRDKNSPITNESNVVDFIYSFYKLIINK